MAKPSPMLPPLDSPDCDGTVAPAVTTDGRAFSATEVTWHDDGDRLLAD